MSDLLKLLAAREERVTLQGVTLLVREVAAAADVSALANADDMIFKLIIACTFVESGDPAFTLDDMPRLKSASNVRLQPLMAAVLRVNGMDIEAEAKNSAASQESGSS